MSTTDEQPSPPGSSCFSFHRIHGSRILLTNGSRTATRDGAVKFYDNGVVYTGLPLSGHAKFVVEAQKLHSSWSGSFKIGIVLIPGEQLKEGFQPPRYSPSTPQSWVWSSLSLHAGQILKTKYGKVNLEDIKKGDKLGIEVTSEGTLSFHVNGENQGPAAHNVYSTDKHVYGFVDHYGQAVTSTITEAFVNPFSLQHLCKRRVLGLLQGNVESLNQTLPEPLIGYLGAG